MKQAATIFLLLATLSLHGCARDFQAELGAAGLRQLQAEADALWREYVDPASGSPRGVVLAREKWPTTVTALSPEEVHVRREGTYIFVSSGYLNSQFLFVPCPKCPASAVIPGSKVPLREIAPRVYERNAQ
jgi:hypothetical protein